MSSGVKGERAIIAIVGAIQFVNILEFMIVMPMGPDFARALGIPTSQLGLIGGSYTAAACVAGLAGSFFLDRFPRRTVIVTAMVGLVLSTGACALATDLTTLMAARVLAGLFGGPATSVAISIITDVVPPERRGRAMGAVMGAFSAASVLGVPLGLELARLVDWRAPFLAMTALGLVVVALARLLLPRLDGHLQGGPRPRVTTASLLQLLARREVLLAYGLVLATMFSSFLLIPNISALLQLNFAYPRDELGLLYLVGGAISFFVMRYAGRLVDRHGSARVAAVGTLAFAGLTWAWAVGQSALLPILPVFVIFMAFQAARNVSQQTLTSKVPGPAERASFQSLQSAVQHAAGSLGAVCSSLLLAERGGRLLGMEQVGILAIGFGLAGIPLAFLLERRVVGSKPGAGLLAVPRRSEG
ncbi:MFS transporter [Vulgatibacter sp.]|uniref:MFS transporter n=1 Tax=Vulgatibacter sp. TaxID=1971226 RepID=UPI003564F212